MARKAKVIDEKTAKVKEATVALDDVEAANAHQKKLEKKRNTKLQEELMYGKTAHKRTVRDTMVERDSKGAYLHDMGHSHRIIMEWDMNEQAIRDQVFKLTIGDKTAYISAVELQKYLRWV